MVRTPNAAHRSFTEVCAGPKTVEQLSKQQLILIAAVLYYVTLSLNVNQTMPEMVTLIRAEDTYSTQSNTMSNKLSTMSDKSNTMSRNFNTMSGKFDMMSNKFNTLYGKFNTMSNKQVFGN